MLSNYLCVCCYAASVLLMLHVVHFNDESLANILNTRI